ncbi:hypothetical protein T01_12606 [Trichinella spiralis]|uniref:Uncharacterized protein n=1 Tax=Trichinella spiralis TaxID=6334 RepID=A0A0V0Z230_TRISP|nr:hypothetical protein T01_12606 [Trichinella spiralis]
MRSRRRSCGIRRHTCQSLNRHSVVYGRTRSRTRTWSGESRREINEHVGFWEVVCGVDLAHQSAILVVGGQSCCVYGW